MSHDQIAMPTPGQRFVIESSAFTADKFVSNRKTKKWDVPPTGVSKTKSTAGKSFESGPVDASEFAPKVVPMCEVEEALGRGAGGEGVEGEGEGQGVCGADVMREKKEKSGSEPEVRMQQCYMEPRSTVCTYMLFL